MRYNAANVSPLQNNAVNKLFQRVKGELMVAFSLEQHL